MVMQYKQSLENLREEKKELTKDLESLMDLYRRNIETKKQICDEMIDVRMMLSAIDEDMNKLLEEQTGNKVISEEENGEFVLD